jgi:hypothetical protein
MGFNMMYPFSLGDLRDSAACLANYLEKGGGSGGKTPWQDLRVRLSGVVCVCVGGVPFHPLPNANR